MAKKRTSNRETRPAIPFLTRSANASASQFVRRMQPCDSGPCPAPECRGCRSSGPRARIQTRSTGWGGRVLYRPFRLLFLEPVPWHSALRRRHWSARRLCRIDARPATQQTRTVGKSNHSARAAIAALDPGKIAMVCTSVIELTGNVGRLRLLVRRLRRRLPQVPILLGFWLPDEPSVEYESLCATIEADDWAGTLAAAVTP